MDYRDKLRIPLINILSTDQDVFLFSEGVEELIRRIDKEEDENKLIDLLELRKQSIPKRSELNKVFINMIKDYDLDPEDPELNRRYNVISNLNLFSLTEVMESCNIEKATIIIKYLTKKEINAIDLNNVKYKEVADIILQELSTESIVDIILKSNKSVNKKIDEIIKIQDTGEKITTNQILSLIKQCSTGKQISRIINNFTLTFQCYEIICYKIKENDIADELFDNLNSSISDLIKNYTFRYYIDLPELPYILDKIKFNPDFDQYTTLIKKNKFDLVKKYWKEEFRGSYFNFEYIKRFDNFLEVFKFLINRLSMDAQHFSYMLIDKDIEEVYDIFKIVLNSRNRKTFIYGFIQNCMFDYNFVPLFKYMNKEEIRNTLIYNKVALDNAILDNKEQVIELLLNRYNKDIEMKRDMMVREL